MPPPQQLKCRQCGAELRKSADSCLQCGCRPPFACSVCQVPIGAYSLRIPTSGKYPYGGFSAEGEPRCHQHRLTRCYRCGGTFYKMDLRRVPGKASAAVCRTCRNAPRTRDKKGPRTLSTAQRAGWMVSIFIVLITILLGGGLILLIIDKAVALR